MDKPIDARRRRVTQLLAALPATLMTPASHVAAQPARRLATRPIPSSGEALPVIGLGTWQVFDVGSDSAARGRLSEVLTIFTQSGASLVDSSPMYGTSEAVVGDLAAALSLHAKLFLATKVWTSGRSEGVRQMELSMRRLRTEKIDLMQVHNLVDVETHTRTLKEWKEAGRVRYTGITHYSASAHAQVEHRLRDDRHDFVQINYSLAERESEERLLPLAAERGIAVIVNRPFGEGSMFRRTRGKPLPGFATELGISSWAQYFLCWILGHPAVTCVIPGTSKPEHMADNLAAGTRPFPDAATRARMAAHFESL